MAAPTPGAQPDAPARDERDVPWATFRQLRREYTDFKRTTESARTQHAQEMARLNQQMQEAAQERNDYRSLRAALNAHPDLAQALYERLSGGRGAPAGAAPAAAVGAPQPSKELANLERQVSAIAGDWAQIKQERAQAAQRAADMELSRQLDTEVKKFLTGKDYPEEYVELARSYVLHRVRAPDMDDATIDDVPYLLNDWFKIMEGGHQRRINRLRDGTRATGAAVPPVTPASPSAPIQQTAPSGALDGTTAALLEAELRKRGWNDGEGKAA